MKRGARRDALNRFCRKSNSKALLLCTDVAARGLNLPKVDWIAQFDPPHEVREYVHRVGRTARSGACGRSILFVCPSEIEYISVLANQGLELTKLSANAVLAGMLSAEDKALRSGSKARKNALINTISRVQAKLESIVEKDDGAQIMAVKAYRSHSRAYVVFERTCRVYQWRSLEKERNRSITSVCRRIYYEILMKRSNTGTQHIPRRARRYFAFEHFILDILPRRSV